MISVEQYSKYKRSKISSVQFHYVSVEKNLSLRIVDDSHLFESFDRIVCTKRQQQLQKAIKYSGISGYNGWITWNATRCQIGFERR